MIKDNGFRLVDDVTKSNVSLIKRLSEHLSIESAWYYICSVYIKVGDKRMMFDIIDDIDNKVKKAARLTVQCAPEKYLLFKFYVYCDHSNFRFRVSM